MRPRPDHIVLFRSGRHLRTALDALRAAFPSSRITVIATPSAVASVSAAGVNERDRIVYDATAFFQPLAFVCSRAWRQALARRPTRVAVLWSTPDGAGHVNIDRTALTLSPRGFLAVTPDGTIVPRGTGAMLAREVQRTAWSLLVGAALQLLLFLPARALRLVRS